MQDNRYHFVYEQDGQDKQLWIHADGYARAYDKFWSQLDGEDNIEKIEVEEHTLQPLSDVEVIHEWVPTHAEH